VQVFAVEDVEAEVGVHVVEVAVALVDAKDAQLLEIIPRQVDQFARLHPRLEQLLDVDLLRVVQLGPEDTQLERGLLIEVVEVLVVLAYYNAVHMDQLVLLGLELRAGLLYKVLLVELELGVVEPREVRPACE
jgi:hypothetical protein